jgi:hypothetical protein
VKVVKAPRTHRKAVNRIDVWTTLRRMVFLSTGHILIPLTLAAQNANEPRLDVATLHDGRVHYEVAPKLINGVPLVSKFWVVEPLNGIGQHFFGQLEHTTAKFAWRRATHKGDRP